MIAWAVAAAAPGAVALQNSWASTDHPSWHHRPSFDDKEWARIADGKTVRRRERLEGSDRVVAMRWSPADKDALWLSIQDEQHFEVVEGYVDEDLPGSTFANRTLYQRIALPWPFAARQWVVDIASNRTLLEATEGRVWERTWTLSSRRGAGAEQADAVWVPENNGGWTLVSVETGTLVLYHTRASPGGNIPDEAGTQWALMTVSGLVERVEQRAVAEIEAHYTPGHAPIERPDGSIIPF